MAGDIAVMTLRFPRGEHDEYKELKKMMGATSWEDWIRRLVKTEKAMLAE